MTETALRIKQLIDLQTNGSVKKFSEKIGISQQKLNRLFNRDTRTGKYPTVPLDIITNITEMFVNVSIEWLVLGNGEMIKGDPSNSTGNSNNKINISNGYMKNVGNSTIKEDCNNIETDVKLLKAENKHLKEKISDLNKQLELKDRIIEMLDQQDRK